MEFTLQMYQESAEYIRRQVGGLQAKTAVVLGTGLSGFSDVLENKTEIPYEDIPHFCKPTVDSHRGRLYYGCVDGKYIFALAGRWHYYEGHCMAQTAYWVRVMKLLGINTIVLTNAVGGINTAYQTGDFMLIKDHIKLSAESPCRGAYIPEFGPMFFDMSDVYASDLRRKIRMAAERAGILLHEGVYCYMGGPQFETPAEINALRMLGGDVVGMSTVPEAIAASQCGIRCAGISCITNMAAGVLPQPLTEEEVVETGRQVQQRFTALLRLTLAQL